MNTTKSPETKRTKRWVSFPVLAALALVIAAAAFEFAPAGSTGDWHTNLENALAVARDENKPVLIDFWSKTCTYCRMMEKDVFSRKDVQQELDRFVTVRIDVDRQPDVANRYNVYGLPTFVVTDGIGMPVKAVSGYQPPEAFIGFLQGATTAP